MSFAMQAASPKSNVELSDCYNIDEDEAEEFYSQFLHETDEDHVSEEKTKCPSCGSTNIRKEKKEFRKGMLALGLVGIIAEGVRSNKMQFVCKKCGYKWDV